MDYLAISRGSRLSSYTQIWLAFLASGFMQARTLHAFAAASSERHCLGEDRRGNGFLSLASGGHHTKDFVQWLWKPYLVGRDNSGASIRKLVGYLWVTVPFWISLPWAADVMMQLTEDSFLGFSVVQGLIGYIPVPS